jgi:hypothetical protein
MKRVLVSAAAAAFALAISTTASAQDAKGMGSKGNMFITADRLVPFFSYTSTSVTATNNNTTTTTTTKGSSLVLLLGTEGQPAVNSIHTIPRAAVDFTVIDRLTVGGAVVLGFGLGGSTSTEVKQGGNTTTNSNDSPTTTIFGIVPRVGYILPLGDVLAFWPRGGFGFYTARTKQVTNNGGPGGGTVTDTDSATIFSLDLDPQLAIIPVEHFYFSAGPLVNIPLSGSLKNERTQGATTTSQSNDISIFHLGIELSLGGWISL